MLILHVCNPWTSLICIARIIMSHYKSNCSAPSAYCHPALPCATKPLKSQHIVYWSKHLTGQFIIISGVHGGGIYSDICYSLSPLLSSVQIKGDGRGLTSGTISGGSSGVSATRQLATTDTTIFLRSEN